MILDREASVREKCLEVLETVILTELSKGSHFVWRLLSLLTDDEDKHHLRYMCIYVLFMIT